MPEGFVPYRVYQTQKLVSLRTYFERKFSMLFPVPLIICILGYGAPVVLPCCHYFKTTCYIEGEQIISLVQKVEDPNGNINKVIALAYFYH